MVFKKSWEKTDTQHQLLPDMAKKMIEIAYPGKTISSCEPISEGCANINIKVQLQEDVHPLILRVYLRDPSAAYREEKLGLKLKPTLPVPLAYYIGKCEGYRFSFTEFIPGILLSELLVSNPLLDLEPIMEEVGNLLAKINSHTFSKAGFFDENLDVVKPVYSKNYLSFAKSCLENSFVKKQLGNKTLLKIKQILDQYSLYLPDESEAHLVHADFDPSNLLTSNSNGTWKITGILDWEFAFSGSILWDVANMLRYAHLMPDSYEKAFLIGLNSSGIKLPKSWRITTHLLNILSLIDCLTRSSSNQTHRCKDIGKLISYTLSQF